MHLFVQAQEGTRVESHPALGTLPSANRVKRQLILAAEFDNFSI